MTIIAARKTMTTEAASAPNISGGRDASRRSEPTRSCRAREAG
jgi:hypothetical protein